MEYLQVYIHFRLTERQIIKEMWEDLKQANNTKESRAIPSKNITDIENDSLGI